MSVGIATGCICLYIGMTNPRHSYIIRVAHRLRTIDGWILRVLKQKCRLGRHLKPHILQDVFMPRASS